MKDSKFNRSVFIDTNIFLRSLVKEDEKSFNDSFKFLRKISEGKIKAYTSTLVLMEINFVLSSFYKFKKETICQALKGILDLPYLKIVDFFNNRVALELYCESKSKFIDCLLFTLLENKQIKTIVSYDRDFDRLGAFRKIPQDFL